MADKRKKADRFLDYAERAMDWLADRPLPKAIGAVISNPTPQEFGAQVANLGASTSQSLQEFSNRVASDPVEAGSLVGPLGAMVAFHGSPYKFNKFSMDKIGTGEGAQAYGHGLYFAGDPGVAKSYQEKLSKSPISSLTDEFNKLEIGGMKLHKVYDINGDWNLIEAAQKNDIEGIKKIADDEIRRWGELANDPGYTYPQYAKTKESNWYNFKKSVDKGIKVEYPSGAFYKADIPDESLMLDWDAPFSDQSTEVKKLLSKSKLFKNISEQPSGQHIYGTIGTMSTVDKPLAESATEELNKLGIKGIKYFDAGSRAAKQGSRNYVVFDDKEIKILERNAEKFLEE